MWDWVGGRFSYAVDLRSLAVVYDNFEELAGANEMDEHFKTTDFENMPVVLALLSVWYNNFFGAESEALILYTVFTKASPYSKEQWK
jgi:glucose-6-phosphate isomerase